MQFINLTPHAVSFQDATGTITTYPASFPVARVSAITIRADDVDGMPTYTDTYGPVEGLLAPVEGVMLIVSGLVLSRPECAGRKDIIAPATGPNDEAVRDDNGRIIAVTRWKRPSL